MHRAMHDLASEHQLTYTLSALRAAAECAERGNARAHCEAHLALSHVFGIGWIVAMRFHDEEHAE